MKKNLPLPKGVEMKEVINQLREAKLNESLLFYKALYSFAQMSANSYKSIVESEKNNILYTLHIVRLMIDCICSMYGVKLSGNPELYIQKFNKNERLDCLRVKGDKLSTNVILKYLNERNNGISELYNESCRYLHPTIYYKHKDKSDSILQMKNKWRIKGNLENRYKIEYILKSLSDILFDIQLEVFNEVIVPLYPDKLSNVEWKKRNVSLDRETCMEYITKKLKQEEKFKLRMLRASEEKSEVERDMG